MDNYFTCPCCGKKTDCLTLCDAHEWEDEAENQKYRELLDKIKPNAGTHAYVGHGCSVCPDCEEAFHWKSKYCPLAIFRNGLYAFGSDGDKEKIIASLKNMVHYWQEQSPDKETFEYRSKLFDFAVEQLKKYSKKS